MANPRELILPFGQGMKRFAPEVQVETTEGAVPLFKLLNLRQLDASLKAIHKRYSIGTFPSETYLAMDGYVRVEFNTFYVYVVSKDGIYLLAYDSGGTNEFIFDGPDTKIKTFSTQLTEKVDTASWQDAVYVASHEFNSIKLDGPTASDVVFGDIATTVKAKHVLVADDRVFYGNLIQDGSKRAYRVIWSDLYTGDNFTLSESSEAGSYDVGFNKNVITGLSQQHGRINIFTQNSIVQARYVGITQGTYTFETLYNGVGNLYHYSVVNGKGADFFIGRDNFYVLDGTQVIPIGDDIWNVWLNIRKNNRETDIRGYFNDLDTEVYWTVLANGNEGTVDNELWDIVYNYKEKQWYLRKNVFVDRYHYDFDIAFSTRTWLDFPDDGAHDWEDYPTEPWTNWITQISEDAEFFLHPTSGLYRIDRSTFLPDPVACTVETHDLIFGSAFSEKEIDSVKIVYEGEHLADTNFKLEIGTRDSYHEAILWSGPMKTGQTNEATVFLRNTEVGKLIRFRLTWSNDDTAYIKRLVGIAVKFTEPIHESLDR
jgi:hypothetical protein